MLPVLVVLSPLPRRHFGAAAGGVHPIITPVSAPQRAPNRHTRSCCHCPLLRLASRAMLADKTSQGEAVSCRSGPFSSLRCSRWRHSPPPPPISLSGGRRGT